MSRARLSWELVSESDSLARSHFCSAVWADRIVIHGGCTTTATAGQRSNLPLDSVVLFDFDPRRADVAAEVVLWIRIQIKSVFRTFVDPDHRIKDDRIEESTGIKGRRIRHNLR